MRARKLLSLSLASTAGIVAVAVAAAPAPLPIRVGVVVDWRPQSHTATVALPSGKLLAIHTSRRFAVGTRVRIEGIKWGVRAEGIKWSEAPQGIKWHTPGGARWGIKWLRNGTFESRLTAIGRTRVTRVNGVVVARFGHRAVAISAPGTTFVVPLRRPAGHVQRAAEVGATVTTRLRIGAGVGADSLRLVSAPAAGRSVPLAGRLEHIDRGSRRIVLANLSNRRYPLRFRLVVPRGLDLARYRVGQELAVTAVPKGDGGLFYAVTTSWNGHPRAADSPAGLRSVIPGWRGAGVPAAPPNADPGQYSADSPPAPSATAAPISFDIATLEAMWKQAHQSGAILQTSVYDSQASRLSRVEAAIAGGDRMGALGELDLFVQVVQQKTPSAIDPAASADLVSYALGVRASLAGQLALRAPDAASEAAPARDPGDSPSSSSVDAG